MKTASPLWVSEDIDSRGQKDQMAVAQVFQHFPGPMYRCNWVAMWCDTNELSKWKKWPQKWRNKDKGGWGQPLDWDTALINPKFTHSWDILSSQRPFVQPKLVRWNGRGVGWQRKWWFKLQRGGEWDGWRMRWLDEMQTGILRIEMIEIGRQKWQGWQTRKEVCQWC